MKKALSIWSASIISVLTIVTMASGGALAAAPITHGPLVRLKHGTSSNWSGYAAYGPSGSFNSVSASWIQPKVSCTSASTYSSFWVGLDGYNSNSVEQLGTEGDCSGGAASYYAWFEMYPKHGYYIGMNVSPNDHMSASVNYTGGGRYTLRLNNTTTGAVFSIMQR